MDRSAGSLLGESYLRTTRATYERLAADAACVDADLFEPLNRALGEHFDFSAIRSALDSQ